MTGGSRARRNEPGSPLLLGATLDADGVNFALFSAHATSVELLRFFQLMIGLRRKRLAPQRERFFSAAPSERGLAQIAWHGCALNQPGWSDGASGVLAFTLAGSSCAADLHVMITM